MRQKKYEITEKETLEAIVKKGFYCSIAFPHEPYPYLVPMNYGYENDTIYLHGALIGERAKIIEESNGNCPVSVLIVTEAKLLLQGEKACNLSAIHESVVIKGKASRVTEEEEKIFAVETLLRQVKEEGRPISARMLEKTLFLKVTVEEMTGSQKTA